MQHSDNQYLLDLPQGRLRYRVIKPQGKVVDTLLLLQDLGHPMQAWTDYFIAPLCRAGLQVITLDYGPLLARGIWPFCQAIQGLAKTLKLDSLHLMAWGGSGGLAHQLMTLKAPFIQSLTWLQPHFLLYEQRHGWIRDIRRRFNPSMTIADLISSATPNHNWLKWHHLFISQELGVEQIWKQRRHMIRQCQPLNELDTQDIQAPVMLIGEDHWLKSQQRPLELYQLGLRSVQITRLTTPLSWLDEEQARAVRLPLMNFYQSIHDYNQLIG